MQNMLFFCVLFCAIIQFNAIKRSEKFYLKVKQNEIEIQFVFTHWISELVAGLKWLLLLLLLQTFPLLEREKRSNNNETTTKKEKKNKKSEFCMAFRIVVIACMACESKRGETTDEYKYAYNCILHFLFFFSFT